MQQVDEAGDVVEGLGRGAVHVAAVVGVGGRDDDLDLGEARRQRAPGIVEDYTRWFLSRLKGFGEVLGGRSYICAGRFTAADISVGYALMLAEFAGLGDQLPDFAKAYWEGLKAEPSYARALAAERRAAEEQGVSPVPSPLGG